MTTMIVEAVKSNPTLYKEFSDKYASQIKEDQERAEKDSNTAMYIDFAINSAINGVINTTLQKHIIRHQYKRL